MASRDKNVSFIGRCNFRGNQRIFGIKGKDRRQHMYVIGKTGVGKTALLKNLALQDIKAGRGIGIIDPHGEFVEEVLSQIPPERTNDVVYFNPVDSDFPIGFNVLEVPDRKYKHLVVSDLLGIFTKIWANVWSARMEYILQNCIMALLDTEGTTLLGIPRLLVDKDYRQKIVSNIKDPVVRSFWIHEYETWRDQFRNEAIVPIQNKVNQFLNTSFIRNIVGQPTSTLNIPEIMNSGKILLVNVSKGKVGEDNSALLGAMIITKIQLSAMERVRIPEEDREDFYLYVDEFQNFATDSFANILSEARKYRLNLILAHQYIGQLVTDVSTKVRDAVFGNAGTLVTFRVGATDAEFLENEFTPEFMMNDLIGIPNHNIYIKLMVDGVTSRPFSAVTLPPLQFETDPSVRETIIKASRAQYAKPRTEVEDKISKWSGIVMAGDNQGAGEDEGKMSDAICWNCGKATQVPFKPDGKRPVYCLSCLKQIEEGKLVPLPERMPKVGRARYADTLGFLGIEFQSQAPVSVRSDVRTERREEGGERRNFSAAPRPREDGRPHAGASAPRGEAYPDARRDHRGPGGDRTGAPRMPQRDFRGERGGNDANRPPVPPRRDRPGDPRAHMAPKTLPTGKPVSLGELKSREDTHPKEERRNDIPRAPGQKPQINVLELRKVLEESLRGVVQKSTPLPASGKDGAPTPASPKENIGAAPKADMKSGNGNGSEIKPGDAVKF